MNIIDADLGTLRKAAKRGRVRSAETQQLMDIIDSLEVGDAKAIVLGRNERPEKIRARVAYAAKIVGKPLQIAISEDRVLFALKEVKRRRGRPRKNP
jgi:ribosomal protein L30E